MSTGCLFFGSVVMQDGRVMVLGGEFTFFGSEDPTGEIYDPATDTWTATVPFPVPLFDPASCRRIRRRHNGLATHHWNS